MPVGALLLIVTVLGVARSSLPQRAATSFWAFECGRHSAPPDRLVYEERKAGAGWSEQAMALPLTDTTGTRRFAQTPRCVQHLPPDASLPAAPLFLGELKSPAGDARVVFVTLPVGSSRSPLTVPNWGPGKGAFTAAHCRNFGTLTQAANPRIRARGLWSTKPAVTVYDLFISEPLRRKMYFDDVARTYQFYAGQRDPADASHFTVDFRADGRQVRLHGRLLNSGDLKVELEALPPEPKRTTGTGEGADGYGG